MIQATIDHILDTLLLITLAAMALVVSANVFCRFLLNFSLYWGDEVAQILLVWLTFLGAAVAVREDKHYYLNFAVRNAHGPWLRAITLSRDVLIILGIAVLLYYSAIVSYQIQDWIMPATEISRSLVYGACPVGCVLMLLYAFRQLHGHLRERSIDSPHSPKVVE